MRILHINCNYIGTTLHQLMIEHLDLLGYENHVFVPTYDKTIAVIEPNENVCVCECFRKWDRIWYDYKQKKIIEAIERRYDVSSFDLIHAYTLFTDGNVARVLSAKYGVPYVVAIRNTDVNDFFRIMIHLRGRGIQIMQKATTVFFLSEEYRKKVFAKYIADKYQTTIRDKTHIIPNGIDKFWLENSPTKRKDFDMSAIRLIYAGRIDRNKNIRTTQKAMEILCKKGYNISLTVVGKVQNKRELRRIKNNSYTAVYPAVTRDMLIEFYRSSDIFVMPSFAESFGLVYAEAMSQGLPVIYSKGQGFDGQFPEGKVGYSVDSRSPESVAEGIRAAIENYARLSANSIISAHCFDWMKISKKYSDIYDRLKKGKLQQI